MKMPILLLFLSLMLCCGKATSKSEEPLLEEFYLGSEIKIEEDKPLQEIYMPFQVYENIKSDKLNDVRVFNASAGIVPHKISKQSQDLHTTTKNIALSKLTRDSDGVKQLIDKYEFSAIDINLNLRANDSQNDAAQQDIYIGEIGETLWGHAELLLAWEFNHEVSYFFSADVEIADDLQHWVTVARNVKLAHLITSEATVKHNKIKLSQFKKKFYRITIRGEHRPAIKSAELKIKNKLDQAYEATHQINGIYDEDNKRRIYYELFAKIPKKRIQILMQEDNVIAKCNIFSRDNEDQNWRKRGSGVIYNIKNDGETLMRDTINLDVSSDRYWRIDVLTRGSGFEQQLPQIKFFWQPHLLTFMARGEGPFMLAYGSAKYATQPPNQDLFFQNVKNGNTDLLIGKPSKVKEGKVMGGENVLKEDLIKVNSKTITLWGVLVIGSLLLLMMAYSLLKNYSTNDEK